MAEGRVFVCSHCARSITAWDEGEPYYRDQRGKKRYAYHPSPERYLCTGIDVCMLCLNCGAERLQDGEAPPALCRKCKTGTLVAAWELAGVTCPSCKQGEFVLSPRPIIS